MPYTPPSQQSPASSKNSTPSISRNASYSNDMANPSSRPNLPRSMSAATYLNKTRRSPSATQSIDMAHEHDRLAATKTAEPPLHMNGSVRQSPPPLNNLLIPTGAIISPPDSSENSDGEERVSRERDLDRSWGELQQAVRSMSLKRDSSPEKKKDTTQLQRSSEPTTKVHSPTALSSEARKISHSRSSTETAIRAPQPRFTESPTQSTDDSEDDDEGRPGKPPLLRKKSGELVKPALRPSSRRRYSSMPGTPTYSKSVHFNDNGNQTRHFLQVDKPMAVSAGTSPVESAYESENEYPFEDRASRAGWDIKLANFPADTPERRAKPVWVERLFLSSDSKSLVGSVAVANISFAKSVAARFTLDYWKTTSEVSAEFDNDVRRQPSEDGYDRFTFTIRLSDQANIENKTLLLCVRYNVIGQEHWDNNDNSNYQIDFVRKVGKKVQHAPQSTLGARPLNAIPRSRHSPPATSHRGRTPSIDDDIVSRFDSGSSAYHFGTPESILGDSSLSTVKLKPRSKRSSGNGPTQQNNGLGGRYDFGASLSAALSNAQDKLGKSSGLMGSQVHKPAMGYFTQSASQEEGAKTEPEPARPDSITTDRPAIGSAQYRDLVSKFCYFTPVATGKLSPQPQTQAKKGETTDGTMDAESPACSTHTADSNSPSPPQSMSPMLDGTNERHIASTGSSSLVSRSASPSTTTRSGGVSARGASPAGFGYPYYYGKRDGYLSESLTPTAIRG